MYAQTFRIRMHDTDAAGILFFTSQLRMAHEAFESFLDSVGLGLGTLLAARDYRIPIVRAESDYRAPVRLGDTLTIRVKLEHAGRTSFALHFGILDDTEREIGAVRTVQVAVDAGTWRKRELPDELREALTSRLG
jgi:1,4-dihydroxy-2-naphthoyl-CoA hydrolase